MKHKILILNGPNLNLLKIREPHIYGNKTLDEINMRIQEFVDKIDTIEVEFFQSNFEGEIIEKLHDCIGKFHAIVFNPAAFTHTSLAIADAIKAIDIPVVEVHLSNIYSREESIRHHSIIASVSIGQISGFQDMSYILAIQAIIDLLNQKDNL